MDNFADKIAKLCLEKYSKLGKTGKPTEKEWTVLSGILLKKRDDSLSLIALATGTKCLGELELINADLEDKGCKLSDSHAEVLARRAFLRYLYEQIDLVLSHVKSDIFVIDDERKIRLHDGISFHFFTSQTPCGDCSIFPKEELYDDTTPPVKTRKCDDSFKKTTMLELDIDGKKSHSMKDIYRTGAKCVKSECQDPRLSGVNYHVLGPLRTKPGRGDPTLSLSCSDKIAKWNILGLQGSLLSILIPSIRMETIVIGGGCPFSLDAMERGLYKRFNKDDCNLKILQTSVAFAQKKSHDRKYPCPSSIVWCAVRNRHTEVAVDGRKQGATKKKKSSNLLISRRALFEQFLKVCDKYHGSDIDIRHPKKLTYLDFKKWSTYYQKSWQTLKLGSFHAWPSKPPYLQSFVL